MKRRIKKTITEPPSFCEYAGGVCDQTFVNSSISDGFFVYPSDPYLIANTIEESIPKFKSTIENIIWPEIPRSNYFLCRSYKK